MQRERPDGQGAVGNVDSGAGFIAPIFGTLPSIAVPVR